MSNQIVYEEPSDLFQGYNRILSTTKETCVTGQISDTIAPSTIGIIDIYYGYLSVAEAIGIDVSASVGIAGLGSVQGKYSFFHSLAVTETSMTVFVRTKVISRIMQVKSAEMKKQTLSEDPSEEDIIDFIKQYGDSYVSSITMGGEYIAAYVFHAETKDEHKTIEESLNLNGIYGSVSADASFSQKITEVSKSVKCRMSFSQSMSGVNGKPLPTKDEIVKFALEFPVTAKDAKAVIYWSLSGYETLLKDKDKDKDKAAKAFDPVVNNREYLYGLPPVSSGKLKDLATLKSIKNKCTELQTTYMFYGGYTDEQLKTRVTKIDNDIKTLVDQIHEFATKPTKLLKDIPLSSLDFGSPKLAVKLDPKSVGNLDGGVKFAHFDDPKSFISKRGKVCYIELDGGARVIGMTTHYNINGVEKSFGNGKEYKQNDDNAKANKDSKKLGGEDYHPILSYEASESGDLSYLLITTDSGFIRSGRLGEAKSISFTKDENQFFLYFEGHTWDNNIVEITFNFGSFKPALWV